jgi:hypothetical protein
MLNGRERRCSGNVVVVDEVVVPLGTRVILLNCVEEGLHQKISPKYLSTKHRVYLNILKNCRRNLSAPRDIISLFSSDARLLQSRQFNTIAGV